MVLQRWTEWGVELDVWCCKDGQNEVLSWMCGVAKMDRMRMFKWMCGFAKMDRMGC